MRSKEVFEDPEVGFLELEDGLLRATNEYLKALGWEQVVGSVDSLQLIPGKGEYELVVRFKGGRSGGKP